MPAALTDRQRMSRSIVPSSGSVRSMWPARRFDQESGESEQVAYDRDRFAYSLRSRARFFVHAKNRPSAPRRGEQSSRPTVQIGVVTWRFY